MFRKTGSFDRCLDRGRWGNSKNARLYIEDAAAAAASLRLTDMDENGLEAFAQCFFNWLRDFVDPEAIEKSEHFSSAATATRCAAPLPTIKDGPTRTAIRKRPAAEARPAPPTLTASEQRVKRALQRFVSQRL